MSRTYTLTMNETQAGTIQIACEVLARLGIGQFRDALEQLPTTEFFPDGWHEDMVAVENILRKHIDRVEPAPQVPASSAVLKAIREANMQLVRTGDDAFMLVPYQQAHVQNPAEIERVANDVSKNGAELNMSTAQQAPQQPCPTCAALARTVMLDQVSFDRKPDCYGIRQITDDEGVEEWEDIRTSPDVAREEANDMMATGRGEIYEVVPLWTTPQPSPMAQAAPAAGAVAGSDDLSGTLRRLDSKELAAWVDRGMALSENLAMYVQADCTLRESQARDMLRAHLFSAQPAPAAPTSPAKAAESVPAPQQPAQDDALIRQLVEALEGYRRNHNDTQPCQTPHCQTPT